MFFRLHDLFQEVILDLTLHKETFSGMKTFVIEAFANKTFCETLASLKHEIECVSRNQNITCFMTILNISK